MKKEQDQLSIVKQKADGMEKMLSQFKVTTDEELGIVADKIKQVKTLQKYIEQEKDKFVAPAKAIIAEAKDKYDPYIAKCRTAEVKLKDLAKFFMIANEQKRLADEAAIVKKVESGYIKPETAMKKMETLSEVPNTVRTDNGSGLRMSKRKVAKIMDPNLIPKEYWIIDEVRVKRDALELYKNHQPLFPGVEIQDEVGLSSI